MEKKNSKIYNVKYPSYITLANPSSKCMQHLQMEKVTRKMKKESRAHFEEKVHFIYSLRLAKNPKCCINSPTELLYFNNCGYQGLTVMSNEEIELV